MAKQMYSFPEIEADELLVELQELGFRDASILQKPTAEGVKPLFEYFLIQVADFPRDALYPKLSSEVAAGFVSNPEHHAESLHRFAFFRSLRSLMSQVGVTDFGWKDLWKPESKRLTHHLSALFNFALYKAGLDSEFAEAEGQCTAEMEAVRKAEADSKKLEDEYEAAVRELEAANIEAAQIKAENLQLAADLHSEESKLKILQLQVRKKHVDLISMEKQLEEVFREIQESEQEHDYWTSRILQDPEQLQAELTRLQHQEQILQAERSTCSEKLGEKTQQLVHLHQLLKEVEKCLDQLEAVKEAVTRKQEFSKQCKGENRQLLERSEKIEDTTTRMRFLETRIQETRERVAVKKERVKAKVVELDECLETVSRQSVKKDPAVKAAIEQLEKLQQQVAAVCHQRDLIKAAQGKKLDNLSAAAQKFQADCLNHAHEMIKVAQQISAACPPNPKLKSTATVPASPGAPLANVSNTPRLRSAKKDPMSASKLPR